MLSSILWRLSVPVSWSHNSFLTRTKDGGRGIRTGMHVEGIQSVLRLGLETSAVRWDSSLKSMTPSASSWLVKLSSSGNDCLPTRKPSAGVCCTSWKGVQSGQKPDAAAFFAISEIVKKSKTDYKLNRLYAGLAEKNIGSAKVLEKNGFKFEGKRLNHLFYSGQFHNQLDYGLLL